MTPIVTTTVVCFRAGDTDYAVPVDNVREIRPAAALMSLPAPRTGVVGLLADRGEAVTVTAQLGAGAKQVLLLDHNDVRFGLLVGEVTGVVPFAGEIGPPPAGQEDELISGTITTPSGMLLLVDVAALDKGMRG